MQFRFVEQKSTWSDSTYTTIEFDDDVTGIAELAALAEWLKTVDDSHEHYELVMDWAADTAEMLEVPFTFTDVEGKTNTYTPASLWEASGGCEWEESAQYGYDYGWNV
jgi:hypothetical protein